MSSASVYCVVQFWIWCEAKEQKVILDRHYYELQEVLAE